MIKHNKNVDTNAHPQINKKIDIQGMHCRSCEILVEEELSKIPGVHKVKVSEKHGTAHIYSTKDITLGEIDEAVKSAGYSLGKGKRSWISKNPQDYKDLAKGALILLGLYFVAKFSGIFDLSFTKSADYTNLPVVFLVGLTAGLSTCMALVGGLVLAVSSKFAEQNKNLSASSKFKPHILFNLGRIVIFFILGGILGLIGSVFQFSLSLVGILTVFVGFTMLLLGLQTLDIFHFLSRIKFTLPKGLYTLLGIKNHHQNEYTDKGAFLLGGFTFFLPCGFTQAMQLFAMTSGSFITGALTMSIFALGTTPGLLSIGGLTSVIKEKTSKLFFKFVGLLVIGLSFYNISNGLNLAGINLFNVAASSKEVAGLEDCDENAEGGFQTSVSCNVKPQNKNTSSKSENTNSGDVQVLKSVYTALNDMQPSSFTVKAGQPVRMEVQAKDDGYGCMGSLALPGLAKKYEIFRKGKTAIIEFTPTKKGTYQITCAMGVPRGTLTVN